MTTSTMGTAGAARGPLHGIRILDACDELAIYGTKLLLNLGAEVIRLEPPGGDPMRSYPPLASLPPSTASSAPSDTISLYFEHFNAGKRSVTLDLTTMSGVASLGRLLATCNAVIESGQAGELLSRRVGRVGEAVLRRARPDLVLVSVTPFGLHGPGSEHQGSDLTITAESGLLALNGRPDAPPYRPGGEQGAHMAGLLAANAVLLGIFDQQRSGKGCHAEVPVNFAATLAILQTANANYHTWHGLNPKRRGMGQPAYRSLFEAKDGWIVLIALPGQWPKLVELLTAHDAAADLAEAMYDDANVRMAQAEHINAVIGAFIRRFDKQALFLLVQQAGVACVPVNGIEDIYADPFLQQRGFFRTLEHPELGRPLAYVRGPFRFASREPGPFAAAPRPGQDNDALLGAEPARAGQRSGSREATNVADRASMTDAAGIGDSTRRDVSETRQV